MISPIYIVTRSNDDFRAGEHICFGADGSLMRIEAKSWIDAHEVPQAIAGLEYLPDRTWLEHNPDWLVMNQQWLASERARLLGMKAKLERRIEALEALEAA